MNILLICQNYPPNFTISAKRWGNLVPEMELLGAHCSVLTFQNGTFRLFASGERTLNCAPNSTGNYPSSYIQGGLLKKITHILGNFLPSIVDASVIPWGLGLIRHYGSWKKHANDADIIIASYGPSGPMFIARFLNRITGTPYVVDIRDSFDSRDRTSSVMLRRASRALEKALLSKAKMRVTIGKNLAFYLAARYQLDFVPVYNGWVDADSIHANKSSGVTKSYLYYAGRIYHHRISALELLLSVLKNNENLSLVIRLIGDHEPVIKLVKELHVADKVALLSPAPAEIIARESAEAKALVILEALDDIRPWDVGTVTGKLISSLASGNDGIVVSSPNLEAYSLAENVPRWYRAHDKKSCEEALAALEVQESWEMSAKLAELHCSAQAKFLFSKLQARLDVSK